MTSPSDPIPGQSLEEMPPSAAAPDLGALDHLTPSTESPIVQTDLAGGDLPIGAQDPELTLPAGEAVVSEEPAPAAPVLIENMPGALPPQEVPVLEAHVENVKAALAEGQAGIYKANEAFARVLQIVEAGPQQELGHQIGVNNKGEQTSGRKMDMGDPRDAALVNEIQTRREQYAAAVKYMPDQAEAAAATDQQTPGGTEA